MGQVPVVRHSEHRSARARRKARIAGVFYLLTILSGAFAAFASGRLLVYSNAVSLVATACYIVVTVLFYSLFKPVDSSLSLIAAVFSLVGCLLGALNVLHWIPSPIRSVNPLVLFGVYCLLIGYLVFRSSFLPRVLGVLMALGGLSWLTFVFPELADSLSPYNLVPGILGEGALTVWLLVAGVNVRRWQERAAAGDL